VVAEDRYSQIFKLDRIRPAVVADCLAELQVRWPDVPIIFCETRQLAEEWTYRYLAAAHSWAHTKTAAIARIGTPAASEPAASELPRPSCRSRLLVNSVPGPAPTDLPCPTVAGYAPRSSPPGARQRRHSRRKKIRFAGCLKACAAVSRRRACAGRCRRAVRASREVDQLVVVVGQLVDGTDAGQAAQTRVGYRADGSVDEGCGVETGNGRTTSFTPTAKSAMAGSTDPLICNGLCPAAS